MNSAESLGNVNSMFNYNSAIVKEGALGTHLWYAREFAGMLDEWEELPWIYVITCVDKAIRFSYYSVRKSAVPGLDTSVFFGSADFEIVLVGMGFELNANDRALLKKLNYYVYNIEHPGFCSGNFVEPTKEELDMLVDFALKVLKFTESHVIE